VDVDEIVDEMELEVPSHPKQQQAAVLFWQYLKLHVQFCVLDDGRSYRQKHVEQFIEINRSRKRCILLVVLQRYTCDVRKYERQKKVLRKFVYPSNPLHLDNF
jgi:hypothetical protein